MKIQLKWPENQQNNVSFGCRFWTAWTWLSPEANVTLIWKKAICKWGISFLCSELQKEMPPLQMAVFKMVFTIASGLCHFIEKNTNKYGFTITINYSISKRCTFIKGLDSELRVSQNITKNFPKDSQ